MEFSGFLDKTIFLLLKVAQAIASCDLEIKLSNGKVTETSSWYGVTISSSSAIGDISCRANLGTSAAETFWRDSVPVSIGILTRCKLLPFSFRDGMRRFWKPENGKISTVPGGLEAVITCDEEFILSGNSVTYCNGSQWILPLGTCQMQNHTGDYSCDFEREDMCGWTASKAIPQPWQRIRAAADFQKKNCLRQDHTFQSDVQGHFIRLQSQVHAFRTYHFMSPILPRSLISGNSLRFQFQLFMFGTEVKNLTVSVKPGSMPAEDMWKTFRAK